MIGRFADWFNSRRWFIRYLLYAEWCLLVTFADWINSRALVELVARRLQYP